MTTAPTIHRQAVRSSVALKALMAVTGLAMIAFLLMHMFGNLKAFLGPGSFDGYAEWLKGDILHPLLPSGTFIWVFRFGMVAVIVGHMYSAAQLWKRARRASPGTYAAKRRLAQTYSSRTMRWGGVILALGLVFHLLQFTVKATLVSAPADSTPYEMIVAEFSVWWLVLCYAAWMVTVCMHIRHGFWSAFATLGANTSLTAQRVLNIAAWAVAATLFVGFMSVPVAILVGLIH